MTHRIKTNEERQAGYLAEIAAKTTPFTMMRQWLAGELFRDTTDYVAEAIRDSTFDWLAGQLALASGAALQAARAALTVAIPDDLRPILDGGEEFIFAVDQAAIALGCDPDLVDLTPRRLQS